MKSPAKKIITGFIILILVGAALDTFFFLKIKDNVEAVHSAEAEAASEQASVEQNRSLQQLAESIQPEIASLDSRVVASDGTAAFIETVESLARTNGLSVTISAVNNAPSAVGNPGSYQLLTLTVATVGSWQNTEKFLSLLETLPYELGLPSITLVENVGNAPSGSGGTSGSSKTADGTQTVVAGSSWSGQFGLSVLQKV